MRDISMSKIPREKFRVVIVYPNLPLMLVPSIAVGLLLQCLNAKDTRSIIRDHALLERRYSVRKPC